MVDGMHDEEKKRSSNHFGHRLSSPPPIFFHPSAHINHKTNNTNTKQPTLKNKSTQIIDSTMKIVDGLPEYQQCISLYI